MIDIEYYISKRPLAFQITRWRFQALYAVREVVLWDTSFVLATPLQSFSCNTVYLPIKPGRIPESVCLQLGSWHGNAFLEIRHKMNQGRAKRGRKFSLSLYIYMDIHVCISEVGCRRNTIKLQARFLSRIAVVLHAKSEQ